MQHIILLEPNRILAKNICMELKKNDINVSVVSNADEAITASDSKLPDLVVSELSIPGHSGSEFLYEFRTYSDWKSVPIVIFSSLKPTQDILSSRDWKLLDIHEFLYKPDTTINNLKMTVLSLLNK
jgi:DNA-binding response OmpR family regulator